MKSPMALPKRTALSAQVQLAGLLISGLLFAAPASADETEAIELDTVQISGKEEKLTEISTEKLLKIPGSGNDPLRAIESLPGVTFTGGRTSAPAVRGSSPDDNAYIIDFIPVGYIFHTDSSSILSDNVVEDFTLETAAFPAQYNNATGAVIDATSRSPYYDRSQFIIDASLLKAGIFIEQPLSENQSFYIAARQSLFQYYIENFLDDEDFEFTTVPEYYDYQGKYEYRISATETLSFQAIGSRDKAGLVFAEDSDTLKQDPGLSGGLAFEAFFNSQGLVWEKFYTSGMSHKIALSQMEQKFGFNIGSDNKIDVKVNDYNLRSQFSYPLNYQHELRWGVELTESQLSYKGRFTGTPCDENKSDFDCNISDGTEILEGRGKPTIYHYDVHFADAWDVTQNWTLTPGVALSYDDYTEQYFGEPRLQSRWQFTNNWWFTSAYGRHHILPDNFGDYVAPFGNPDLKQPTATHYELGIENQLANDMLWKVEVYYKDLDNIITSRPRKELYYDELSEDEYNNLPRYTNDADGKAWGMEFFLNKNLTERWYGWVSVAYSRTFRTNNLTGDDFSFNYDQPVIINSVANYKLNKDWQVGFKWRYQSGQLVTPLAYVEGPDAEGKYTAFPGNLNSERLPAYHKLDVRADRTYRFSGWEMDFYAEILNLYGRDNVTGYEYKGADYSEKEEVTDLPTIISFGIKAKI
ncbi:TonB-dependent receptor plug domain-containing protein [Thalassolituus sp. UBA2009]|uniref:TonB-dependent receptor plug domain-containing protein n=1 Tax=Thalassolituus sp. UBA2009 TaxID=1947658 RepID=UPI00257E3AF8|nr:TonB-dependent receptor [Thalassolituus sp. UBA2009]